MDEIACLLSIRPSSCTGDTTLSKTAARRELAILQTEARQETEIVGGFFCKEEGTETEAKEGNGKLCAES